MIEVNEAIKHIDTQARVLDAESCKLEETLGHVLAEDIKAPINMPPFRQSSMDGYALREHDNEYYELVGEVPAGKSKDIALKPGQAVRIFTGARVPDDADRVVMQEHTGRENSKLHIQKMPDKGSNIRPVGEQVLKGDIVMPKATPLSEAGIGFLTGLGMEEARVYKKPRIAIMITGDELQQAGRELEDGQVYESNSLTLKMALARIGHAQVDIVKVADTLEETTRAIEKALKNHDLLLISGGISVGDYDFVRAALLDNHVKEIFYKVNQKPGKPLWYGTQGTKQIFGLPGNPASSLSCFYIYVRYALFKAMGHASWDPFEHDAELSEQINNPFRKVLFLKATVSKGKLSPLGGQASSMLRSFALCNALAVVPADVERLEAGTRITYIAL